MSVLDNVLSPDLRWHWMEALGIAHRDPKFKMYAVFECCPEGVLPNVLGLGGAISLALPLALVIGWFWASHKRLVYLLGVAWLLLVGAVIAIEFDHPIGWTFLAWAPVQIAVNGLVLLVIPAMLAYGLRCFYNLVIPRKQFATP